MKISPEWEPRIEALPQGIFFTLFVLFFVALALFLALLFRQFELTLFALTLLFLAVGLKIWSRSSTKNLSVLLSVDKPRVFPDEKIDLRLMVENGKLLPVFVQIRMLLPESLAGDKENLAIKRQCGVLWYQKIRFHQGLSPTRRGVFNCGTPQLITGDFFGFFPRPVRTQESIDILVFPRLIGVKPFPILNRMLFGKKADSSPITDPIHILGTRDYRAFSSSRNIHWKATARYQKLQEKIFEVSEQEKLFMVLEGDGFTDHEDEAAFEKSISAIASLSTEFVGRQYAVGFLTNCKIYQQAPNALLPERKTAHLPRLFQMLAKITSDVTCPLNTLLTESPHHFDGASCLCFSYDPISAGSFPAQSNLQVSNIICGPRKRGSETEKVQISSFRSCLLEDICEVG